jgi:hypothetical protein
MNYCVSAVAGTRNPGALRLLEFKATWKCEKLHSRGLDFSRWWGFDIWMKVLSQPAEPPVQLGQDRMGIEQIA